MDQVYARLKRLRKSPFRRAISGGKLFDFKIPDKGSWIEYDPNTLLNDGEWYKVSDFRAKPYCPDILVNGVVSADIDELAKNEFEDVAYLISVQDEDFFFQRVRPNALLKRKFLVFGDAAVLEEPKSRIIIDPQPDAIFIQESNVLLFRNLASISPIFSGIDTLYKEATKEQVEEFFNYDFISSHLTHDKVSKPNRKRIALAMETLRGMSEKEKNTVFGYINQYAKGKLQFNAKTRIFTVKNDDELKTFFMVSSNASIRHRSIRRSVLPIRS